MQPRSRRHEGRYYKVPGIHLCAPSPQRTPVLFRSGASKRGTAFAARHAEVTFVSGPSKAVVGKYVDALRSAVAAGGRKPKQLLIYAQALIITAATEAEARAKYEEYRSHIDIEGALALLSGRTGVDFSRYALDATIDYIDSDAGRSALASFSQADPGKKWTVGEAAEFIGLSGRGPVLIGDAAQVADQLEAWQDETGIDGFNLAYTAGTLRQKLLGPNARMQA